jgi:hypothetical protein
MTAYYVQPEPSAAGGETYWLEGYAVGDAKFAAAQSDGTSTTLAAPTRIQLTGMLSEAEVTSLFGGNRVVAAGVSQSPASATVTGSVRIRTAGMRSSSIGTTLVGGYRVRANGSLSQATITALIGANATFDAYAVPRSLYVDAGYYEPNYVDYAISSYSLVQPNVIRTRIGIASNAQGTMPVSAGLIRTNTGALSVGLSATIAGGAMTYNSNAFLQEAASTVLASLSEKWIDLAEDGDIWTDQAEDTDTWSLVAEASGTWTSISEDTDIWTDVSEDTDTWTTQSPLT